MEPKRELLLYTTSETSVEDSDDGLDGGVGADILRKLKSQTPGKLIILKDTFWDCSFWII